jgi:hypothetical protein
MTNYSKKEFNMIERMTKDQYVKSFNWQKSGNVLVNRSCATKPDGPHALEFTHNGERFLTYDEYYTDIVITDL